MSCRSWPALGLGLFLCAGAQAQNCSYETIKVEEKNLVANLFLPKTAGKVAVVIAVGGSEGGLSTGNANGEMLAPHCLAVLGLAYFKEPGLAQTLDQIPLEYFVRAVDYLGTLARVDANRIGLVGGSRGAELALLLASMEPRIKSVVATTPSGVAWYGRTTARSAWTLNGKDVPALSLPPDDGAPQLSRFEAALNQPERVRQAFFPLERINGPILLISARNDQVWPSYRMGREIEDYLKERQFPHAVGHLSYPTGHGFSRETAPGIKRTIVEFFLRTLDVVAP